MSNLVKNAGFGLEFESTEELINDYADRLAGADVGDIEDLAWFYRENPSELPEPFEYEFFNTYFDDILSVALTIE